MKIFLSSLFYLLKIQVSAFVILFFYRLILFILNFNNLLNESIPLNISLKSFLYGVWFDNVIGSYILLIALLIISISSLFNNYNKKIYQFISIWFIVLYSIVFSISAANIPYFQYFSKHINSSVFNWIEYGKTTFGMITGEAIYLYCFVLWIVSVIAFSVLVKRFEKKLLNRSEAQSVSLTNRIAILSTSVLMIGLCLFGIRGRIGYNPIKVSAAYYCQNAFLNQLGISPTFNLLRSSLEASKKENREISFMDEHLAMNNARRYLNITDSIPEISMIAHRVTAAKKCTKKNVVLVFMESMSASLLKRYGNQSDLTPYLDSLSQHSIAFDKIYSAGIHTNHGVFATLYSYPAIMKRNAMKGAVIQNYAGLPTILKDNDYNTMFFMTHESQYDNMNGFLRTNGFDQIYSQENYPSSKVVNSFGVPDDYLFEFAIPVINDNAKKGKPFFASLLTISNHPPYVIPKYFKPKSANVEQQIVEYADWSIRRFMEKAKTQSWYNNTLFVFVADHGKLVGEADSEMPLCYNHIPLFIYTPDSSIAKSNNCLGSQIDIAPTVLGMLNISYTNTGFGIDLLKDKRDCVFFTADNTIGCIDNDYFYILDPQDNIEWLYKINPKNQKLQIASDKAKQFFLKDYSLSMLQTAQTIMLKDKTGGKKKKTVNSINQLADK